MDTVSASERMDFDAALPPGVNVVRDVSYGIDPAQRMDVYMPRVRDAGAPVIFMVHGGAWRLGDKASQSVVANKVRRWVPRGIVFISVNYRMLPQTDPLRQADDVARALAAAQSHAASWGADPARFILMGHSAGAHLVALLNAAPARATEIGARPWLGTVSLDSAALDVVQLMQARHAPLYDRAFGAQLSYWQSVSPFHAVAERTPPLMAVCSTRRANSCAQATHYSEKALSLGNRVQVLKQNLSHHDINADLGSPGAYTDAVEEFMASLGSAGRDRFTRAAKQ